MISIAQLLIIEIRIKREKKRGKKCKDSKVELFV